MSETIPRPDYFLSRDSHVSLAESRLSGDWMNAEGEGEAWFLEPEDGEAEKELEQVREEFAGILGVEPSHVKVRSPSRAEETHDQYEFHMEFDLEDYELDVEESWLDYETWAMEEIEEPEEIRGASRVHKLEMEKSFYNAFWERLSNIGPPDKIYEDGKKVMGYVDSGKG